MKPRLFTIWIAVCLLLVSCTGMGATPEPTLQPVTIRFGYWGNVSQYQGLAAQFHTENPSITINLIPVSFQTSNSGFDRLHSLFKETDVMRVNYAFLNPDDLAQMRPLDEFLAMESNFPRDDVFPGLMAAIQQDGKQLGLPAGVDPVVMFYEGLRLKIAGATPLAADYTLDDLIAAAGTVNNPEADRDSGKFSYGFCANFYTDIQVLQALFGGGPYNDPSKPNFPTFNDPANVEAIQWYASLWNEYHITQPISENDYAEGAYRYLSANACGYWMDYYDGLGIFRDMTIQPHMLPLPKAKGVYKDVVWDGYFMTRASTHPREAWQWMQFLFQNQEGSGAQIPPLLSQIASKEYAQRVTPDALEIAKGLAKNASLAPLSSITTDTYQSYNLYLDAVRKVIRGEADAQTALDEAQGEAEKSLSGGN